MVSLFDKMMKFNFFDDFVEINVNEVLIIVYDVFQEKGYNLINQIVGYLLLGDFVYIFRYCDVCNLICKFERDELIEELVKFYLEQYKEV